MKLPHPFYRLPLQFDIERLQQEVSQFADSEWQRHPTGYPGNSAIRLISVDGGENDDFGGVMQMTPHLRRCPYIRQVLSQFGVVWSRARLMRLAPGADVPEHCDYNYHWFHRVRVHIPVFTDAGVDFTTAGKTVHMRAGEAWIFDNWRNHSVHNGSPRGRIHLVADTTGNAAFWNLVNAAQTSDFDSRSGSSPILMPYRVGVEATPFLERFNVPTVMPPSEVDQLVSDLLVDLKQPETAEQRRDCDNFYALGTSYCREWRTLWSLYADTVEGWPYFGQLRDHVANELSKIGKGAVSVSNGIAMVTAFETRVLAYAVRQEAGRPAADFDRTISGSAVPGVGPRSAPPVRFSKPLFIVAAPRSGSTLLFETLTQARDLYNMGGEAHSLVEGLESLRPGAPGVGSNRLNEMNVDGGVRAHVFGELRARLRDRTGAAPSGDAVRFLEKTPKNALRIPFFDALFPDARYVFLWRDPRENISSIMEAWRSGGWQMYPQLPGWDGPWSMLVPPGYEALRGKPLEELGAFQWARANEIALDDLSRLAPDRWLALSYADFLRDPASAVRRICGFAELEYDDQLESYLTRPLPLSKHTLTAPAPEKWRANEDAIARVLPSLASLTARLAELGSAG